MGCGFAVSIARCRSGCSRNHHHGGARPGFSSRTCIAVISLVTGGTCGTCAAGVSGITCIACIARCTRGACGSRHGHGSGRHYHHCGFFTGNKGQGGDDCEESCLEFHGDSFKGKNCKKGCNPTERCQPVWHRCAQCKPSIVVVPLPLCAMTNIGATNLPHAKRASVAMNQPRTGVEQSSLSHRHYKQFLQSSNHVAAKAYPLMYRCTHAP